MALSFSQGSSRFICQKMVLQFCSSWSTHKIHKRGVSFADLHANNLCYLASHGCLLLSEAPPVPCCLVAGKAIRGRGQETLHLIFLNGPHCSTQQCQCLLDIGTPADSMPVGPGTRVPQRKPNNSNHSPSYWTINCFRCLTPQRPYFFSTTH